MQTPRLLYLLILACATMCQAQPFTLVIPRAPITPTTHSATPLNAAAFLASIRAVEGDDWTIAPGGYGLSPATWRQHSKSSYALARNPDAARRVALIHLRWLTQTLAAQHRPVDVYTVALAWRFGVDGSLRYRGQSSYANRAKNLYETRFSP